MSPTEALVCVDGRLWARDDKDDVMTFRHEVIKDIRLEAARLGPMPAPWSSSGVTRASLLIISAL